MFLFENVIICLLHHGRCVWFQARGPPQELWELAALGVECMIAFNSSQLTNLSERSGQSDADDAASWKPGGAVPAAVNRAIQRCNQHLTTLARKPCPEHAADTSGVGARAAAAFQRLVGAVARLSNSMQDRDVEDMMG